MVGEQEIECCLVRAARDDIDDTDEARDRLGEGAADVGRATAWEDVDLRSALTEADELRPVATTGKIEDGKSNEPENRWYMLVFFLSTFFASSALSFCFAAMACRMCCCVFKKCSWLFCIDFTALKMIDKIKVIL